MAVLSSAATPEGFFNFVDAHQRVRHMSMACVHVCRGGVRVSVVRVAPFLRTWTAVHVCKRGLTWVSDHKISRCMLLLLCFLPLLLAIALLLSFSCQIRSS